MIHNHKVCMSIVFVLIALIVIVFASACSYVVPKEAEFEIIEKEFGWTSYGCLFVKLTIENTGNATGYNVACNIHMGRMRAFAYFADGGNIEPGERACDDAYFLTFDSKPSGVTYDLSWLTRN